MPVDAPPPPAFQSTPPARGATTNLKPCPFCGGISIHAPREGGDIRVALYIRVSSISIHAPREGGDSPLTCTRGRLQSIFQSTPPARGATAMPIVISATSGFQSTPPARGATTPPGWRSRTDCDFNPRPPRGGRLQQRVCYKDGSLISIHAPREGGDTTEAKIFHAAPLFQSTPPARGATFLWLCACCVAAYFNPRPPRGGRPSDAP